MIEMRISLPEDMKPLVDARIRDGLYADISDYVRDLIRSDLSVQGEGEPSPELIAALEEGEASGLSDKTFDQIVAEERARFRSS
ncbi:antitoxin ParD1/3/4 [Sphingomonas sp. BE123]|jgi:antitoxin ParD1/3/4|uniref:ribbon-helix-helix domain-containing protein n=1 Tax=Sphingomonas sp. BE123 TaxID=2817842 RepID=UPI00285944F3|nr:type II toxin-antitoxin system ParD family antitoxin [Sphingomonas sp. BE123]MDR6851339.1 antitoxin ParD1/3/4 [Sphingomonas sp. BE123]